MYVNIPLNLLNDVFINKFDWIDEIILPETNQKYTETPYDFIKSHNYV